MIHPLLDWPGSYPPMTRIINPYAYAGAPPGVSWLLQEDFTSGYGLSWTEAGTGTITPGYATSPAPLDGAGSLRINISAQTRTTFTVLSADQTTLEAYFMFRFVSTLPASGKLFFRFRDVSAVEVLRMEVGASSRLTVRCGTASALTTDAIAADTTYHAWLRYVAGSGANAQATLGFSTDGTRPTSGSKFASLTNGSRTTAVNNLMFGPENSSTWQGIFDKLRADPSVIGNNGDSHS